MIYDLRFTISKVAAALLVLTSSFIIHNSALAYDGYTALTDTNGTLLPGQFLDASNLIGHLPPSTVPTNVLTVSNANLLVLFTNTSNGSYTLLGTNGHVRFVDEYQTTNDFTTNGIFVGGTNGSSLNYSNATGTLRISGPIFSGGNVLAPSNTFAPTLQFVGTNNIQSGAQNSFELGGSGSSISSGVPNTFNSGMVGGEGHLLSGACTDCIFIGGQTNRCDYSGQSAIIGGFKDWLSIATQSAIVGGYSNWISGTGNVILGGWGNNIAQAGTAYDVVFGQTNILYNGANFDFIGGAGVTSSQPFVFIYNGGYPGAPVSPITNSTALFLVTNGLAIGTNSTGTNLTPGLVNMLNVFGNANATSYSIQGTNLVLVISNVLLTVPIPQLVTASNALQLQLNANTLGVFNLSNNVYSTISAETTARSAGWLSLSNYTAYASNVLQNSSTATKAFTATLASTFTSQGQGFNTPLMPDGNYSVSLQAQDDQTARSFATNAWHVGSKSTTGFTIFIPVQNNFQLNFDCIVKENTQ